MNLRALLVFFTLAQPFGFVLHAQKQVREAYYIDSLFLENDLPFSLKQWDNRNGLPQNAVNDMLQWPGNGDVILAGNRGLVFFNGLTFRTDPNLEALRPMWPITDVYRDAKNRLWILGDGRIGWRDSTGWHLLPRTFEPGTLLRFFPAGNDFPAVYTRYGCFQLSATGANPYSPLGLKSGIADLKPGALGETWILTAQALHGPNQATFKLDASEGGKVLPLSDGRIVVLTNDSIYFFQGAKRRQFFNPFSPGEVSSIEIYRKGLLFATYNGLYYWEPGKKRPRRYAQEFLRSPFVTSLADGAGNIWLGSSNAGAALLQSRAVFYPPEYEESAIWPISGVYYDRTEEKLLVGPNCGILSVIGRENRTIITSQGGCAQTFYRYSPRLLFVGTLGEGLQTLTGTGDSTRSIPASKFPPRMVLSAIETQPGIVTFGTEDGLWSYNGTTYYKTAAQNLPPATRVYCQWIDRQKRHWLGTDRITGFIVKGQFQAADPNVNLAGVRAMYEDQQGTLWLGTHGQGLFAYHNNTLRRIQPPGMRLPATVSTLIPVFDTLLAVSSNEGLYLINLNHLHNHLRQPDAPVGYLALIDNNGLKNKEFNGGFQNAAALLPSGNLVFPTIQGAVMLDPHKLNLIPKPIQVRVKEVWTDEERHDPAKPVLIPNDFGLLRIITRLGFRDHPHQYIAEYAIDGSNWLPILNGEIQIRGLQPGNHTLEVRGYPTLYPHLVNSAKVDLRVPVPLTQNPSFYLVLFFVVLAFVFVFLRIRTLQISRSNEKLQALVEEKTADLEGMVDELKQSQEMLLQTNYTLGRIMSVLSHNVKGPLKYMTHIAEFLQSNADKTTPEDLKQTLGSVVDSGKGMVDLMEDVLQWAKVQGTRMELNRTTLSLNKKLEEEMLIQAAPAQQKQVELINETTEDITFETDGNLLSLILQNLLSNAIKFSLPGQQVLLKAKIRDGKVQISVTDHGVGISAADLKNLFNPKRTESKVGTGGEKGSGIGLLITKDLVTRLDGKIWAISREDHGTTFFIELPERPT